MIIDRTVLIGVGVAAVVAACGSSSAEIAVVNKSDTAIGRP